MYGLLGSVTLFKMRPAKINIAVNVFQRSIMVYIFNAIKMPWMFLSRQGGTVN